MLDQLQNLVGVADLVVVPGNDLHEGVGQGDAGVGIEDGGAGVAQEVGGHDGLVGVTQNALQLALGGGLHSGADLLVLGGLGQVDGQVNNGNVQSGNTHGHAGQLAVELGDDLADSLGSAGGGGDDVVVDNSSFKSNNGKGKTTAAMGLTVRALGSGMKVVLTQFMKGDYSSELKILREIPNLQLVFCEKNFGFVWNITIL